MVRTKEAVRRNGKLWHKEKDNLTLVEARVLKKRLKETESVKVRVINDSKHKGRYKVWWSK